MAAKSIMKRVDQKSLLAAAWGQETVIELVRNVQTHRLQLKALADLTIAGGAASGVVQNRGSLLSLFNLAIEDSGTRETIVEGRVAKVFAEMFAPRPLNDYLRLAAGDAAANIPLYESLPFHFALPVSGNPQETAFMERDPSKPLRLVLTTVPDARNTLTSGNDRTWTWNVFTVELGQKVDPYTRVKPLFVLVMRKLASLIVAGAAADIGIPITSDKWLHSIVVQSTAGGYEVADIIDSLELKSDRRSYYDVKFSAGFLAGAEQAVFGGGVPVGGYFGFLFAESGRLSNCLNPVEDSNLVARISVDALSATPGTNVVTVWGLECQRVAGLTADDLGFTV